MAFCSICEEELGEHDPSIENWDDDDGNGGFIVREMICDNEDCPLFEQQQDWFFDFTRVDVDGDNMNFLEAIKVMKEEKKVTRRAWFENGLYWVCFDKNTQIVYSSYTGKQYSPYQPNLIAIDWELLNIIVAEKESSFEVKEKKEFE